MPCHTPVKAWKLLNQTNTKSGKNVIRIWKKGNDWKDVKGRERLLLRCGYCTNCQMHKARLWSLRITQEASMYTRDSIPYNCFLTLTFDNKHLPKDQSLDIKHMQKFMKDLRQFARRGFKYEGKLYKQTEGIKFFLCGEYGEKLSRPHYHICLFNWDFIDKEIFKINNGLEIYTSRQLAQIWKNGIHSIQDLNENTAAYTARYTTKKVYKRDGDVKGYYQNRKPEFINMSKRIGKKFIDVYGLDEIYNDDTCLLGERNLKLKPPRYYDDILEKEQPNRLKLIKERRIKKAIEITKHAPPIHSTIKLDKIRLQGKARQYETDISISI